MASPVTPDGDKYFWKVTGSAGLYDKLGVGVFLGQLDCIPPLLRLSRDKRVNCGRSSRERDGHHAKIKTQSKVGNMIITEGLTLTSSVGARTRAGSATTMEADKAKEPKGT